MKQKDIQLLFWTTAISNDSFALEDIEKETKLIKSTCFQLQSNITEVETKLKKEREILAKNISTTARTTHISEFRQVSQAALIYDRKITDGFRMHMMRHFFINSEKVDNLTNTNNNSLNYGIQFSEFNSLFDYEFIPIHSSQIRDITSLGLDIITASLDKSIAITDINAQKVKNKFVATNALWCCLKVNDSVIGAGGDRGLFSLIDTRNGQIIFSKQIAGPPVNSMEMLNDNTIMGLTAKDLYFYDIKKGDFINFPKTVGGGFSIRGCSGSSFFVMISRQNEVSSASFCAVDSSKQFTSFSSFEIGNFRHMIRPSLYQYENVFYSAIPNEPCLNFSLYGLSRPKYDIWNQWKSRWSSIEDPSQCKPVLDCLIFEECEEFIVATLSSNHIKMYTIPPS